MSEKNYIKNKSQKQSKKIKLVSGDENQTSQSGIIPICKYLEQLGLKKYFNKELKKGRYCNTKYSYCEIFLLSVLSIAGGATSIELISYIGQDRVLRRVLSWIRVPHPTTLSRMFKSFVEKDIYKLECLNHRLRGLVWRRHKHKGKPIYKEKSRNYIDIDSTVITVYGKQEGTSKGYNPTKLGKRSYHPLIAFFANTKEILQATLRTGSCYTSNGIIGFCKQMFASLPSARFIVRADSGFFAGDFLSYLEENKQGYLIKVKLDKRLKRELVQKKWTKVKNNPGWEECSFEYSCENWQKKRKYLVVREVIEEARLGVPLQEYTEGEYNYFCYVTTEDDTPWKAHKEYGQRATCETFIDEAKNQIALGKIRTDNFLANSALFQASVIAYNTFHWMVLSSENKTLRKWEIKTIRLFLIRVSGRLVQKAKQLTLKTPRDLLHAFLFKEWNRIGLCYLN